MEITAHKVEGDAAPQVKIETTDQPGAGGAYHGYLITVGDGQLVHNPSYDIAARNSGIHIVFQNGAIKDAGMNGVTVEALLAIAAHRLQCFQEGPYPAQENATALSNINNAIRALQQRTLKRIARGVEGTQQA